MSEPDEDETTQNTMPAVPEPPSGVRAAIPEGTGFVGRYQLCFELASGGMAKVYLARVEGIAGFEKLVALKRIHSHLADQEEFVEMFLDEARIASRIDHPNVCTVFDFGRADDDYYIAMEFLLGETVARVMRIAAATPELVRSPRWTAVVLRFVAEACEGLHAAHELKNDKGALLNVVHRDVSPHNLFVGYDGTVKIVDFGIARAADRLHHTRAGMVKGRHAYMSPEQAEGRPIDRRADIWSLGVILFEALTGKRLFRRATDTDTLMAVVRDPIPKPSDFWLEIPPDVEAAVLRALQRDPSDRWANARELGRELERCIVRLDQPAGKAELADLMEELLPEQREERQRMVSDARTMDAGVVRRVLDDSSPLAVEAVAPFSSVERRRIRRRGKRASAFALASGILGGVLLTLLLMVALGGEGEDPASAASPPDALPSEMEHASAEESSGERQPGASVAVVDGQQGDERGDDREDEQVDARSDDEAEGVEPPDGADEPPRPEDEATPPAPAPVQAARQTTTQRTTRREAEARDDSEDPERSDRRWRAPVARAEPGTVSVVTPGGWAEVYHGGRRVGRSPGRFELPAGAQTLVLRPFGDQPPRTVRVQVPSGGQARVSVRLEP